MVYVECECCMRFSSQSVKQRKMYEFLCCVCVCVRASVSVFFACKTAHRNREQDFANARAHVTHPSLLQCKLWKKGILRLSHATVRVIHNFYCLPYCRCSSRIFFLLLCCFCPLLDCCCVCRLVSHYIESFRLWLGQNFRENEWCLYFGWTSLFLLANINECCICSRSSLPLLLPHFIFLCFSFVWWCMDKRAQC